MNHPWQSQAIADQHRNDLQATARAQHVTKTLLTALRRPVGRAPAQQLPAGERRSRGFAPASNR
jgi:hypothetical protein